MTYIRPCADLRNNYNEISKICHETNKPVYITKNGFTDLVVLSDKAYEQYEEERLNKLITEQIEKKYPDFESFKKDVYEKLEQGLKDIAEGRYQPMEEAVTEMEAEYGISLQK